MAKTYLPTEPETASFSVTIPVEDRDGFDADQKASGLPRHAFLTACLRAGRDTLRPEIEARANAARSASADDQSEAAS